MIHALKDSAGDNRTKSYLPLYKSGHSTLVGIKTKNQNQLDVKVGISLKLTS